MIESATMIHLGLLNQVAVACLGLSHRGFVWQSFEARSPVGTYTLHRPHLVLAGCMQVIKGACKRTKEICDSGRKQLVFEVKGDWKVLESWRDGEMER